jgi:hypothetical protein
MMRKNFGKPDIKNDSKAKVSPKKKDVQAETKKRKVSDR